MVDVNGNGTAPEQVFRIGTNGGGDREFPNRLQLTWFAKNTASAVTGLLQALLMAYDHHESSLTESLRATNDLAWQLEQACELLFPEEEKAHG